MHDLLSECPKRRSVPKAEIKGIDGIISNLDMQYERLRKLVQTDAAAVSGDQGFSQRVKLNATLRALPESFGSAQKSMEALLQKGRRDAGREEVKQIFGDCERIAHIQALIERLESIVPSDFKDDRLQTCRKACETVEQVLTDIGLGEKLRNARQEIRDSLDSPAAPPPPTFSKLSSAARQQLLADIDDLADDECHRQEVSEKIEVLFHGYADDLDFLTGDSYDLAVEDLTRYIRKEWDDRNTRLRASGKDVVAQAYEAETDEFLKEWVIKSIDPNGDGCITLSEAMQGFERCVNEIDPPTGVN